MTSNRPHRPYHRALTLSLTHTNTIVHTHTPIHPPTHTHTHTYTHTPTHPTHTPHTHTPHTHLTHLCGLRCIIQYCVAITRRGVSSAPETVHVSTILGVINVIVKEDLHRKEDQTDKVRPAPPILQLNVSANLFHLEEGVPCHQAV